MSVEKKGIKILLVDDDEAAQAGRSGNSRATRQFHVRHSAFALKVAKDFPVDLVELDATHEWFLQVRGMRNNITISGPAGKPRTSIRCSTPNALQGAPS